MKHNILLPIFLVLSWLSGLNSAPSYAMAFNNGSIEAYLTKACSPTDPSGGINIEVIGGTGPFIVEIKNSLGATVHWASFENTPGNHMLGEEDIVGIIPGTYIVKVTDFMCSVATMVVVVTSDGPPDFEYSSFNDICNSGSGLIRFKSTEVMSIKMVIPYETTLEGTEIEFKDLTPDVYKFEISRPDSKCNPRVFYQTIKNFESLEIEPNVQPSMCINKGHIEYEVDENISNKINFRWDNGSTEREISNLAAGRYKVTITIGNCTFTDEIEVKNLDITKKVTNPQCGKNDGKIEIGLNEVPIDEIKWSNGQTTSAIKNLPPGFYSVTVSANGCTQSENFQINEILMDEHSFIVHCNEGTYSLTPSLLPGTNVSYLWSTGETTSSINIIPSTIYKVTLTQDNCLESSMYSFENIEYLIHPNVKCEDFYVPGEILATSFLPGSSFIWENHDDNWWHSLDHESIHSVAYKYDNCEFNNIFAVPDEIFDVFISDFKNPTDACTRNGSISVGTSLDKTLPIKYRWSNGLSGPKISNLSEGRYTVTATLGPCSRTISIDLCFCSGCSEDIGGLEVDYFQSCAQGPTLNASINSASSLESNDGAINIETDGSNLTFKWKTISSRTILVNYFKKDLTNVTSGLYELEVNDGCSITIRQYYIPHNGPCSNEKFDIILINNPCPEGNYIIKPLNSGKLVSYSVDNSAYFTIKNSNDPLIVSAKSNSVEITAYDIESGCVIRKSFNTSNENINSLKVDIDLASLISCDKGVGFVKGIINGGNKPLIARWLFNGKVVSNNEFLSWSSSGFYTFEVFDNCGFRASKSINLSCECTDQAFPNIIQISPCLDGCGFLEDHCSKIRITKCSVKGNFKIIWPDNSVSTLNDCKLNGKREFEINNFGDFNIVVISESGCIKNQTFSFNEPWCVLTTGKEFGYITSLEGHKGGCNEAINTDFPDAIGDIIYIPDDYNKPCQSGKLIINTPTCPDLTLIKNEMYVDTNNPINGFQSEGEFDIYDNCAICIFTNNNLFNGQELGAKYCRNCPSTLRLNSVKLVNGSCLIKFMINSPFSGKFSVIYEEECGCPSGETSAFILGEIDVLPGLNEYTIENLYCNSLGVESRIKIEGINPFNGENCKLVSNSKTKEKGLVDPDCESTLLSIVKENNSKYFLSFVSAVSPDGDFYVSEISSYLEDNNTHLKTVNSIIVENNSSYHVVKDSNNINNYYLLSKYGSFSYKKVDSQGNNVWDINLPDFNPINITPKPSGNNEILGYNSTKKEWQSMKINHDGDITQIKNLNIPNHPYHFLEIGNSTLCGFIKDNNTLMFSAFGTTKYNELPSVFNVKDIKNTISGTYIIAGDFRGKMEVGNKSYESDENCVALIEFSDTGEIVSSKILESDRDEFLNGIALGSNNEIAYQGKYFDELYSSLNPDETLIDSCIFIKVTTLKDSCTATVPILTVNEEKCRLEMDIEQGNTYILQIMDNEGWNNINNTLWPYPFQKNGLYRVISSRVGCLSAISEEIEVKCHPDCIIEQTIDVAYSSSTNNFIHFYKNSFDSTLIKGQWIDPVKYQDYLPLFEFNFTDIIIKQIITDHQGHVYLVGNDPLMTSRLVVIKYSYVYNHIIWTQKIENSSIETIIPYTVASQTIDIIVKQIPSTNLVTYKLSQSNGVLISLSPIQIRYTGKLVSNFSLLKWINSYEYGFVETGSSSFNYVGNINSWTTSLPPNVIVRNFVKVNSGNIILAGEFTGSLVFDGTTYDVGYIRTMVFLTLNTYGQIINIRVSNLNEHFILKTFITDGFHNFYYTGYVSQILFADSLINNPSLIQSSNSICVKSGGFSLLNLANRNSSQTSPSSLKVYPNPFTNNIDVEYDSVNEEKIILAIEDISGRNIANYSYIAQIGKNRFSINNLFNIPEGLYLIKVNSSSINKVFKLMKIE